jgi:hypothetical protein
MNRIWRCPDATHAGVRAPARLRKIDVRRYCLACSEREGVLVERVNAPAEQARDKRRTRKLLKERAARARQAAAKIRHREWIAAHRVVDGLDLAKEWRRVWCVAFALYREQLDAEDTRGALSGRDTPRNRRTLPMLYVRSAREVSVKVNSYAVVLSISKDATREDIARHLLDAVTCFIVFALNIDHEKRSGVRAEIEWMAYRGPVSESWLRTGQRAPRCPSPGFAVPIQPVQIHV